MIAAIIYGVAAAAIYFAGYLIGYWNGRVTEAKKTITKLRAIRADLEQ